MARRCELTDRQLALTEDFLPAREMERLPRHAQRHLLVASLGSAVRCASNDEEGKSQQDGRDDGVRRGYRCGKYEEQCEPTTPVAQSDECQRCSCVQSNESW